MHFCLQTALVEKAIEAFIMGLEIYNKPTIKYRIEGFSFFICNAWDLMLKAEIINRFSEKEIYFKDKPNRTLSLDNCIEQIFPNKHGSLRKNLIQIIDLRNTSTHFITEDYEMIYAPLFQACVINFVNKLNKFHGIDITERVPQNFLSLSVRLDSLTEDEINAKYSPQMAKKLLSEKSKIDKAISENNANYAIPLETKFYLTKDKNNADLVIGIDSSSNSQARIIKEIKDPNKLYPLITKDLIRIINTKLKTQNIQITKYVNGEKQKTNFTTNDLKLFNKFYDIKNNPKYSFHILIGNRYGYSHALCDFIVSEIKKDTEHFVENMKRAK